MCVQRAKPSNNKHGATARGKPQPPERKDERKQRESHARGANARATRGRLGKDRATRSESETKANEERGAENSEHDKASKEHNEIEASIDAIVCCSIQAKSGIHT